MERADEFEVLENYSYKWKKEFKSCPLSIKDSMLLINLNYKGQTSWNTPRTKSLVMSFIFNMLYNDIVTTESGFYRYAMWRMQRLSETGPNVWWRWNGLVNFKGQRKGKLINCTSSRIVRIITELIIITLVTFTLYYKVKYL